MASATSDKESSVLINAIAMIGEEGYRYGSPDCGSSDVRRFTLDQMKSNRVSLHP